MIERAFSIPNLLQPVDFVSRSMAATHDAHTALRELNDWFQSLKVRQLDVKSFSSGETVILDGDTLIAHILDDPSLAIAKAHGPPGQPTDR